MSDFPGKGTVAVIKTTPDTVLDDIQEVMHLAKFEEALPKENSRRLPSQRRAAMGTAPPITPTARIASAAMILTDSRLMRVPHHG